MTWANRQSEKFNRHFWRVGGIAVAKHNLIVMLADQALRPIRLYLSIFLRFLPAGNGLEPLPMKREMQGAHDLKTKHDFGFARGQHATLVSAIEHKQQSVFFGFYGIVQRLFFRCGQNPLSALWTHRKIKSICDFAQISYARPSAFFSILTGRLDLVGAADTAQGGRGNRRVWQKPPRNLPDRQAPEVLIVEQTAQTSVPIFGCDVVEGVMTLKLGLGEFVTDCGVVKECFGFHNSDNLTQR